MRRAPEAALDTSVPAFVFKVGHYPFDHGGLGVVRTLGRAGVAVDAVVESRNAPTARSRYLRKPFVWATSGREDPEQVAARLVEIGMCLERPVLITTDDEAASLVCTHADALKEHFRFLSPPAPLTHRLASKRGLYEICRTNGVETPSTRFPRWRSDVMAAAAEIGYPLVVKNVDPWERLRSPAVDRTTLVADSMQLRRLVGGWPGRPEVLLQEYIPRAASQDWVFHGCFDRNSRCIAGFTGQKLRSWPPHAGVTTHALMTRDVTVAELSIGLAARIGYQGIADLDWRLDTRDGRYRLLDFNPRVGAQFRLFEDAAGIDVVRALHLELTGRPPSTASHPDRRFTLETLDLLARPAYRTFGLGGGSRRLAHERAWYGRDDPVPAALAVSRFGAAGLARLFTGTKRRDEPPASADAVVRAVKSVPATNRSTGPNDPAAASPAKYRPGTEDMKAADSLGHPATQSILTRRAGSRYRSAVRSGR